MILLNLIFMGSVLIVTFFSTAAFGEQASSNAQTSGTFQAVTIALPIAAGVVGYFITYYNSWRLERRKAELKFVSDQLQYLYGPLFALSEAGRRAIRSLADRHNLKDYYFEPGRPTYSEYDIKDYRLWMSEVLMPINLRIEKVIIENVHLIQGEVMPDVFKEVLAHVATYKAVMKTWPDDPPKGEVRYKDAIAENTAMIAFPPHFSDHVGNVFNELKKQQSRLIGLIR